MNITDEKKAARKHYLAERRQLDGEYVSFASQRIRESIFMLALSEQADTVLLFYPIKNEPDLCELVKQLNAENISVGFPISVEETVTLDFRTVADLSDMREGAYGIPEPRANAPTVSVSEHSICVVPALAFDRMGGRLGYGKGYYDRYLASFSGKSVGAVYSRFVTDKLPTDRYDLCVDLIITEGGVILPDEVNKRVIPPQKEVKDS